MPTFRRGLGAIEDAATANNNNKGSNFQPFTPQVYWKDDKETKYVLFLSPVDQTYTVDLHDWIPTTHEKGNGQTYTRNEQFISRKDPSIGEDFDDLEDRLGSKTKLRTLGVAVELEPVMETVEGRQRPKSFVVRTDSYTKGNEEVIQPKIGVVTQAAKNFWGWIGSFDSGQNKLTTSPLQVVRRGKDANTTYDFIPVDLPVDFTPLFDYLDGLSYLNELDPKLVVEQAKNEGSDQKAAEFIGDVLLTKRIDELTDADRYKRLVDPITEYKNPYNTDAKKAPTPSTPPAADPDPTPDTSSKMDKFAALRAKVEG